MTSKYLETLNLINFILQNMIDGCQYHEERCTVQRWISQLSSLKMTNQAVRRNGEFLEAIEQEELKPLEIKECQHLSNI